MTTAGLSIGAPPEGLPDPNIAPPQLARSGDPFARVRVVHFLSRLPRNTTLQLRDVVAALNAAFLDWSFSEKVVLAELVQLQANWAISLAETSAVPSVVELGAISRRPMAGALCTGRIDIDPERRFLWNLMLRRASASARICARVNP